MATRTYTKRPLRLYGPIIPESLSAVATTRKPRSTTSSLASAEKTAKSLGEGLYVVTDRTSTEVHVFRIRQT